MKELERGRESKGTRVLLPCDFVKMLVRMLLVGPHGML